MLPLHIGQKIKGTVEKLVFGGLGLIRHQGIVVFVPDVIPGEQVICEITRCKARYAEGTLLHVEHPSPHRKTSSCPYFGQCGGCQLQHIDPSIHPSLKKEWLQSALYKVLPQHLSFDFVPAEQIFGWRRKITLHARWNDTGFSGCGFFAKDNASIITITECPLFFSSSDTQLLTALVNAMKKLPLRGSAEVDITVFRLPGDGFSVTLTGSNPLPSVHQKLLIHDLSSISSLRTLSVRFPNLRYDNGPTDFSFQALGKTWYFSIDAFIQNHPTLSELLWHDIIDAVHSSGPNQIILDLYSGIGVTAISLARLGHTVTAVELSTAAVRAAQKSAQDVIFHGQNNRLKLLNCSVEEFVPTFKGLGDWWIVNPPRTGLSKEVASLILKKKPKQILYVSCSPPTLARDITLFSKAGMHVTWIKGYDMFPQTTHFETVAIIER